MSIKSNKFKQNYLLALVVFITVTGILGWIFYKSFMPGSYFSAYPTIPFIFLMFGVSFIAVIHNCEVKGIGVAKPFLIFKSIKFLIAITIIFAYLWIAKVHVREFAITFVVYYLLYIIFETVAVAKYEKMIKGNK